MKRETGRDGYETAVGVDAGGTKVAAVLLDDGGNVLERRSAPMPAEDGDASASLIASLAKELAALRGRPRAIGVGAAGMVEPTGTVRFSPNVAWREFPLAEHVRRSAGIPTIVDNDANAAAWGEFRLGAGAGTRDMLLVTVGTGIGGGIVSGGRLMRGAHGFAAEIGHLVVEPGGEPCGCGNRGCWEQVASGQALERMAREVCRTAPRSLVAELAGGDPLKVRGPLVTAAASRGDAAARGIFEELGRRLGEGIAGLVNVLDPERVVLSGGVLEAGEVLLRPLREAFEGSLEGREYRPEVPVLPAGLGADAGAMGAALLALENAA